MEREHEDPDCPVPEYEMGDSEPCEMEEEVSISFALRETIREVILVDGSLGTEKGLELVAVLGADIPDDPDDVPF